MKKILALSVIAFALVVTSLDAKPIRKIRLANPGPDGYKYTTATEKLFGWHLNCHSPGTLNCFGFGRSMAEDPREIDLMDEAEAAIANGQFTGSITIDGLTLSWTGSPDEILMEFSGD